MSIAIRQIHPVFVGEVSGIDISRPLSPDEVAAIDEGMVRYAVRVFHDQKITDEQQMAFTVTPRSRNSSTCTAGGPGIS